MGQNMNITANIRAIDSIKSEILKEVSKLYCEIADFDDVSYYENVSSSIATIIAMDYILARRMGLDMPDIDRSIVELAGLAAENGHELEVAFSDMSELKGYIKSRLR